MMEKTINNLSHNYKKLSIQVSLNGLSFCILDSLSQTIVAIEEHRFEAVGNIFILLEKVKHLTKTSPTLAQSFEKIFIAHTNELSSLVPNAFFNEKKLADYLKFNNKILVNDFITFDRIPNNDMVNVYVPYMNLNNHFFDCFGEFEYKHFSSILIERLLATTTYSEVPTMYAHIQEKQFEIVVIHKKKLLLYNSFIYDTKEDFIYYLLFCAEQLELNTEEFNLYLLGSINKEDELYEIAYRYVRNVHLGKRNTSFYFDGHIQSMEEHNHFILLNHLS